MEFKKIKLLYSQHLETKERFTDPGEQCLWEMNICEKAQELDCSEEMRASLKWYLSLFIDVDFVE